MTVPVLDPADEVTRTLAAANGCNGLPMTMPVGTGCGDARRWRSANRKDRYLNAAARDRSVRAVVQDSNRPPPVGIVPVVLVD